MSYRPSRVARAATLCLCIAAWATAPTFAPAQQPAASAAKAQELKAELDALRERFETAETAHYTELKALYDGFDAEHASEAERIAHETKVAALDAKEPSAAFVKEFAALAERAKGTDVAAEALMQVLALDRTEPGAADGPGRKALAALLAEHLHSPALDTLPSILQYAPSIDGKLRSETYKQLASQSRVDAVKAASLFALAKELTVAESKGGDHAEARRMFVDLQERFGALESSRGKTYAALARGFIYELDHLQLGMQAPDFEATDENGVKFKLSDYKGKVLILDFWGNW